MSATTKKNFITDISFIAVSRYSGIFVGILINAILVRLLSPDDYGIVALATVFSAFFNLFTSMGIGPAIIQNRKLTERDLSNIFGFTFWMGLILAVIFFLCSNWIADFYKNKTLISICRWLSLQIFLSSLCIVPEALLSRQKLFKYIAKRNLSFQVFAGIISIVLAFKGFGVYTLLVSPLFTETMNFIVNEYKVKQKINIFPSITPLKKNFNFSIFQFLFNLINFFGNNFGSMVIGKVMSVAAIGYYNKAGSLINLPVSNINGVITPVLFPYLVDYQNNKEKIFSIFHRLNLLLATLAFPLSSLLYMCSKEIILILYGPQWTVVISCFAILTLIVGMQISSVSISAVLQAIGKTHIMFILGFMNTIVSLIGLVFAISFFKTIDGLALMAVFSSTFAALASLIVLYKVIFRKKLKVYFIYLIRPILFFAIMIFISYFINELVYDNIFVSLIIKIIIFGICFFLFLKYFTPYEPLTYIKYAKFKLTRKG